MLYFSIAFCALTAIKQLEWSSLHSHHSAIHCSEASGRGYHDAAYNSFPNLNIDPTNYDKVTGNCATGHKIHTSGPMTRISGLMTHTPCTGLMSRTGLITHAPCTGLMTRNPRTGLTIHDAPTSHHAVICCSDDSCHG